MSVSFRQRRVYRTLLRNPLRFYAHSVLWWSETLFSEEKSLLAHHRQQKSVCFRSLTTYWRAVLEVSCRVASFLENNTKAPSWIWDNYKITDGKKSSKSARCNRWGKLFTRSHAVVVGFSHILSSLARFLRVELNDSFISHVILVRVELCNGSMGHMLIAVLSDVTSWPIGKLLTDRSLTGSPFKKNFNRSQPCLGRIASFMKSLQHNSPPPFSRSVEISYVLLFHV